jgi:S1-C subfamily serine protease
VILTLQNDSETIFSIDYGTFISNIIGMNNGHYTFQEAFAQTEGGKPVTGPYELGKTNRLISYDLNFTQLYERSKNSIVQVSTTWSGIGSAIGTGVVFDEQGNIVTNEHVVVDMDTGRIGSVGITFADGTEYDAKVIGIDKITDLALLHVENAPIDKIIPLPLGNSSAVKIGEPVAAIGNPLGFTETMSTGIVSGLGRISSDVLLRSEAPLPVVENPDLIQTDTAINHGNSGGPLLNMRGEVIGINELAAGGQNIGLNFAIPSNTVVKVAKSLITKGYFEHPWLGVTGVSMSSAVAKILGLEEPKGFLVVSTASNSAAQKAGIHGGNRPFNIGGKPINLGGDVILKIDEKDVRNIDDILVYLLREKDVGDNVQLTVWRNGQIGQITVTLEPIPPNLQGIIL